MEKKINIAELLKDCPKGMELDCTMYDRITFDEVTKVIGFDDKERVKIIISTHYSDGTKDEINLTEFGTYTDDETAKCVIFPKGKTTWEGFHRPFKDGDIVHVCDEYSDATLTYIAILKQIEKGGKIYSHCFYNFEDNYFSTQDFLYDGYNTRFATEEEKQKLFDAIKTNGYKWNEETKNLEMLVEAKFKVGDRIKARSEYKKYITDGYISTITSIKNGRYWAGMRAIEYINEQDDWELVPNKFDITTLKPFDKVLVRADNKHRWSIQFFERLNNVLKDSFVCLGGVRYRQCIPYEGNEHLLNTANDCDDFYKTWEK